MKHLIQHVLQDRLLKSPTYNEMTQRNEKDLVEARRTFYQRAKVEVNMLQVGEFAGKQLFDI